MAECRYCETPLTSPVELERELCRDCQNQGGRVCAACGASLLELEERETGVCLQCLHHDPLGG